jgi:pimeloyl-ACP methyl ester carboxylesterase
MKKKWFLLLIPAWLLFAQFGVPLRMTDDAAQAEFKQHGLQAKFITLTVDNVGMHYVKTGSDTLPTLFFVHGSPGSWKVYKRFLLDPQLEQRFRMIAIDRPGFGYSNYGHAYHLKQQSGLIYGIVAHEQNGKPMHLIGHSLGGPIVVQIAQDHPQAYASITSLAGSISPYDEPVEKWRAIFVDNPMQYLLPGAYRTCNTEIHYFKKELYGMDPHYDRLTMPVTFIHGDADNLVTVNNVAYGKRRLAFNKHIKVIILHGANHYIPKEHFDIVKAHLLTLAVK